MSKNSINFFFKLSCNQINILAYDFSSDTTLFNEEIKYETNLENINSSELIKSLESKVFLIEDKLGIFLKDTSIILDDHKPLTIGFSLSKNVSGRKLNHNEIKYLVIDAKSQIEQSNPEMKICHILIDSYKIDKKEFFSIPEETACNEISLDIRFICYHLKSLNFIKSLLGKISISTKKFLCKEYVDEFYPIELKMSECQSAYYIQEGKNMNEIEISPKKMVHKGFFERLFLLFN